MKLNKKFYLQDNVVCVAAELIGKTLFTNFKDRLTGGIITETEAYNGITDKASHAYNGRRTPRTEVMYSEGGIAYVYLCYGLHALFNVVTNNKEIPQAVLIRAIKPITGIETMKKRRGALISEKELCNGPGKVSQALGIQISHSGTDLGGNQIWLEDNPIRPPENQILITPRIGIDYAGADADLPYRFVWKNMQEKSKD